MSIQWKSDPSQYLESCDIIDFRDSNLVKVAAQLVCADEKLTAEQCFRFVRDQVKHSSDHKLNPVTCRASEVLASGTGFCYAKSHLLCALLRANAIPAGLCYQRLSVDGVGPPYCLHGLSAVFLSNSGWYRIDARGNRGEIRADFTPPRESLAFSTDLPGEYDLPEIHIAPLQIIVDSLRRHPTWDALAANLPDDPRSR